MSDINRKPLVDKPYVEIGGIRWATMNIGANSETDYGLYFQWGDTAGYTSSQCGSSTTANKKPFYREDCVLHNGTSNTGATSFTKYNLSTDTKTKLDETDDAAVANWGGSWRMPTKENWAALGSATTSALTSDYQGSGVSGLVLTDKTDSSKKLFFPAAGDCYNSSVSSVGSSGHYWSSSLSRGTLANAYNMSFYSSSVDWQNFNYRYYGFSVRPIQNVYKDISITLTGDEVSNITLKLINREGVSYTAVTDENGTAEFSQVLGGSCTLFADGGNLSTSTIIVDSSTSSFTIEFHPYEYVDLGLSVKWAKCNIGAEKESDYGLYFQWGDTQGYTAEQVGSGSGQKYFGWADYKYSNNGGSTAADMTKYNTSDGKTVLEASDDAATANMGGSWRMPTEAEFNELINTANTTSAWTTVNEVYGVKFISKKSGYTDKYVFFPAAGYCISGRLENRGYGYVWSSTLYSSNVIGGSILKFYGGYRSMDYFDRRFGFSVRGVFGG